MRIVADLDGQIAANERWRQISSTKENFRTSFYGKKYCHELNYGVSIYLKELRALVTE
jgi:hypothetical protein